jgi:23S rRNA pseudouridine1911/1915/1917 synthase
MMYNRNQPNYQYSDADTDAQHWTIQDEQVGLRLDRFLTSVLPDISRTGVQQLISDGAVLVNEKPGKSGYALRPHDRVAVLHTSTRRVAWEGSPQATQTLPLEIVYEDDDILIINKAAGMVVHPAPGHYDDTLVNALVARYPEFQEEADRQSLRGNLRPGIVHRLDRDTSGLLIVAKNANVQKALKEQMKQHEIEKRYIALVEGNVSLDHGSIDAPIGRDPRHRRQMTVTTIDSREARTHFRVLERFARHTLLLVQLETGRTHQIRVHLKAIGHPIVGDPVYGSGRVSNDIALQRQFLHACQLRLTHPSTGKALEVEAPLPSDLQALLDHPERL